MSNDVSTVKKYPLLTELLTALQLQIRATYSIGDVGRLFGVSSRAIQSRVASGQLTARDLPGRARFLSEDLETFLASSKRRLRRVASDAESSIIFHAARTRTASENMCDGVVTFTLCPPSTPFC